MESLELQKTNKSYKTSDDLSFSIVSLNDGTLSPVVLKHPYPGGELICLRLQETSYNIYGIVVISKMATSYGFFLILGNK